MTGTTISGHTTIGLSLSAADQNPVSVLSTGEIYTTASSAIYSSNGKIFWNIDNQGTLKSAAGSGIALFGAGDLINGAATNQSATIFGSKNGIYFAGTVDNLGTISGESGVGIAAFGSSYITNGNSNDIKALIDGQSFGIQFSNTGTLINFGTVAAASLSAAVFNTSATVLNGSTSDTSALLSGGGQGLAIGGHGTIENYGTIFGDASIGVSAYGVFLGGGGSLYNAGVIDGPTGVAMSGNSKYENSLVNAGTIIGNYDRHGSTAVYFLSDGLGDQVGHLTVDPNAVFEGAVKGFKEISGNRTSLELAAGADQGTISGIGTQFTNFQSIAIDAGASWVLSGTSIGLADGETITGFTVGDTIILDSFSESGATFTSGIGLVLSTLGGQNVTLDIAGRFGFGTGTVLQATTSGGNTTLSVASIADTLAISISHELYLDYPVYGSPFTITDTGTIVAQPEEFLGGGLRIGFRSVTVDNMGAIYGATALKPPEYRNEYESSDGVLLISAADVLINNSGRITGGQGYSGVFFPLSDTLINTGIISGGAGGTINTNGGVGVVGLGDDVIINAGTIAGAPGNGPSAASGYALRIGNSTLVAEPGAVFIGKVNGDSLVLAGSTSGNLDMGGSFSGFDSITFAPGAAWTLAGTTAELAAGETISGFTFGDTIDLTGFAAASKTFVSGKGLILSSGTVHDTLSLTGSFTTRNFTITSDDSGGTIIEVTCFVHGTRITTTRGEIPVEQLAIGDTVKTLHAGGQKIKWIGRRHYAAPFANHKKILPIRIQAGAIADGIPSRDLAVSPGHAICIGNVLIHARHLVNGVTITQAQSVSEVAYYHIELENHEVIFAENCPAETFCGEVFRNQFQNAAEFSTLYPGHSAPEIMCLPRLEQGFQLGAITRRLKARAGIPVQARHGPLRGFIDQTAPGHCAGWAQNSSTPEEPVCLDILANGKFQGRALANAYRPDLQTAGYGSGNHGFTFKLAKDSSGPIIVRRSFDKTPLGHAKAPLRKQFIL